MKNLGLLKGGMCLAEDGQHWGINESSIWNIWDKEYEIRPTFWWAVLAYSFCDGNLAYSMQFQVMDVQTYHMYDIDKLE
jgi:hypothetical protein